jgi:hypothetical protein
LIEHVESPDVLRRATFDAHLVVRACVRSFAEEGGREPAATTVHARGRDHPPVPCS